MSADERVTAKQAARKATEAALLRAATRMVFESPGNDVLASLRPVDVVRRADPPRTTGAFYNIWPTQADFRRALLDHLLSLDRFKIDEDTRQSLRDHLARTDFRMDEAIRVAASMNFEGLKHEPALRVQHALWTHAVTDELIREKVKALYVAISDSLTPIYSAMLERSGRRMRPPHTVDTLAVVLAALVEGLQIRWTVEPEAVPDDFGAPPGVEASSQRPWNMFASVAHIVFMGMSEPAPLP
jgi:hypothetical protein